MIKKQILIAAAMFCAATNANADVNLNIYNNDLALVKDTRKAELKMGNQKLFIEGVSAQLIPQSVFVLGQDINVVEKNYDYNLINKSNLLDYYIGKEVQAVSQNPQTGKDIYQKATVLANNGGSAVLKFANGVDANYSGRIIFDDVPKSLSAKPQLQVVLDNAIQGPKELELVYLTTGLSWQANYIANVTGDESLDINTSVTLTNNSGVDYQNAKIRVVAGDVNKVQAPAIREAYADEAAPMYKSMSFGATMAGASNTAQAVADYYYYELDTNTTIKDKQSKQVALFNKNNVKYKKTYKLASPLYISRSANKSEFEKLNPSIVFNITNDAASNLDVLLPSGVIRFYEDSNDNTTFLGEATIAQTSKGETLELALGKTSDIYAKAKILNVDKVSKDISDINAEVLLQNSSKEEKEVIFEQNIYGDWKILEENYASVKKNSRTAQWSVMVPASGQVLISYKLRVEN